MALTTLIKFTDIYPITKKMEKKEKGDLFELFTYYLFKHDPRLNNNLQKIWLFNDIPKSILKELNLPSTDKGIDILAIINNKYYAIQCKFRQNPDQIISWTSLSTFFGLSFGMNDKIAGGYLVTNTNDLCQEVINSNKVTPIYGDFYDLLSETFFKNLTNTKINYERKWKLDHQIECITAARVHFFDHRRGFMEMACGSGKTLASYWIANALYPKRIVIFVPSLQLLSQFYTDWVNQSYAEERHLNYLLIGSDADVDDDIKYKSNGLLLHIDPIEIKKCMQEEMVVICTYQSSDKLAGEKFDLGIFDEAHKTVGQKGKQFSRMLTNDEVFIEKRLFMTATPKVYVGDNDDIASMSDTKIYGERIYTYNTGNAIKDGRLTDYQVLTIYATNDAIKKDIQKNKLVKYKKEFDDTESRYLGIILVILKKINDGTINHLITYHSTIAKAKKFAEFVSKINKLVNDDEICVSSIDGGDSMRMRKNIVREFSEAPIGILCSARVLNEGVNIPVVDSVCFVDSRESVIDVVQCVGRCLRLYEGKKMAYVIVPIFVDNFDNEFDKDEYGTVIKILKALKNTDEGVVEYFRSRGNMGGGRKIVSGESYVDVSEEIDFVEWCGGVDGEMWKVVDGWGSRYDELKQWIDDNKKLPSYGSDNHIERCLGSWCSDQRKNNKKNLLTMRKKEDLEKLKYWHWGLDCLWNEKFNKTQLWIKKNGRLPFNGSVDIHEKTCASWCSNQRQNKKNNILTPDRIEMLESLDGWYWDGDKVWDSNYNRVNEWIEKNHMMPSSKSDNDVERKLGIWLVRQRKFKKNSKLTVDKVARLEKIDGMYWERDDLWDEKFIETKKWIQKHNRIPSAKSNETKEREVGIWCATQRKNKNISDERKKKLETVDGWYWEKSDLWDMIYANLSAWIIMNNKMPNSHSDDLAEKKIAVWCGTQRQDKKNNKLSVSRIDRLEKLDGWHWNLDYVWMDKYVQTKEWIEINNKIPSSTSRNIDEKILGKWCSHQRENKKKRDYLRCKLNN